MLKHAGRWDWFQIPLAWVKALGTGVPGIVVNNDGTFEVHRSHLPMLERAGLPVMDALAALAKGPYHDLVPALPAGMTFRPWQARAAPWAAPRRGTLIVAEPRMGKGQPLSAKVLTPRGWTTIGKLQLGAAVVDPDGGAATVRGIYPQGVKRVYRVTTSDGAVTECDEDHLWLVQTSRMEGLGRAPRVLSTKELIERGVQLRERARTKHGRAPGRWILPLTAPVQFVAGAALPVDPYIMGLLLGDGGLRRAVGFTSADPETVRALREEVEHLGLRLTPNGKYDYRVVGRRGAGNPLLNTLRDLGLMGSYSYEKFIPAMYKTASVSARRALLAGLMDTDGYAGLATQFYTTSNQLRDDFIELVRSLGGHAWFKTKQAPKYTHNGEDRVGRPCHIVTLVIDQNPFRLPRKVAAWRPNTQRRRKIASIEYVRDEATVCIRVSSRRHLYITDGYIVTHNTSLALALHDPSTGPLVVLAPLDVRKVWCDWIERMFPGAQVLCLEGRTVDREAIKAADFIFAHYDIVTHQQLVSLTPGTLIVDEAHLLSNATSLRSQGVRFFAGSARRVVVLTGTPLWNSTKGLWPLVATANPGAWGSKPFQFQQRYCSPVVMEYGWAYGEISNEDEWLARRGEVVFEANWATERPDLAPTIRNFIEVPIDLDAYGELDIAVESLRDTSLPDSTIGTINRYRQITGRLKAAAVAARALANPAPVVTWAWHKAIAKEIGKITKKAGRPTFFIHGDLSAPARAVALDAWRQTPDGILSATWSVGQVGIDLSHAKHAMAAEIDWTPAVIYQGEMRTFDPERAMTMDYFSVDHPVEKLLVDKVVAKLARGAASAMPAAGSGFQLSTAEQDDDGLLAALNEIVSRTTATF